VPAINKPRERIQRRLPMIVLGYSGFDRSVDFARREPGIRPGEERMVQGFDSACAILLDGEVIAAAAEERFSLEKHTNRFPRNAIRYCLKAANVRLSQVERIVHGFNYEKYASIFRGTDRYEQVLDPARQKDVWMRVFGEEFRPTTFGTVEHHLAHAASAYFPSGFETSLCLVCDGMGEVDAITLYEVNCGKFTKLDSLLIPNSIGILYGIITSQLGFAFNADEYKLMGLAPYGDPSRFRGLFERLIKPTDGGRYMIDWNICGENAFHSPYYRKILEYLDREVLPRPESSETHSQPYKDLAASVQEALENSITRLLCHWATKTGQKNLCMTGGVALNCTLNGKLIKQKLFEDLFIQPAAGDDGTALGAALFASHNLEPDKFHTQRRPMPFFGPEYSQTEMNAAAEKFVGKIIIDDLGTPERAASDAAEALSKDAIVAWFQGRMEYGPRALGNRSITANPMISDIKERLNAIIKLREGFRPFAPAVAAEHASRYFEIGDGASPFDYMLATTMVRPEWRERLPGITHVDGSARVQTVSSENNRLFYLLIEEFAKRTGIHALVNTSFNIRGQPMIVSPEIAIETILKVRIDRLYLGSLRIVRRN